MSRTGPRMVTEMKQGILAALLISLLMPMAVSANGDVRLIGHYDDIRTFDSSDPHQLGHGVDLYRRADGTWFGTFIYAPGTTEGISAVLYDVHSANHGKNFEFKAKLSSGTESNQGSFRDSRDAFAFTGSISDRWIVGKLVRKDGYEPAKKASTTSIKLKRDRSRINGAYRPASYEEWLANAPPLVGW